MSSRGARHLRRAGVASSGSRHFPKCAQFVMDCNTWFASCAPCCRLQLISCSSSSQERLRDLSCDDAEDGDVSSGIRREGGRAHCENKMRGGGGGGINQNRGSEHTCWPPHAGVLVMKSLFTR